VIVVVGAGAAGLAAAIAAAEGARPVLVLERTVRGGMKILISGGGRCNVLPSQLETERFVSEAPQRLVRGLLKSWPIESQRAFFEHEVRVPLTLEAETGKLFPASDRARDIRDGLLRLAAEKGAQVRFSTMVTGLRREDASWLVETSAGTFKASSVILATGGLSVPNTGSDGTGLLIAQSLGHRICATYPALTPLLALPAPFDEAQRSPEQGRGAPPHIHLSGVSLPVRLRARWNDRVIESRGGFLFTHRGYSGPAVLDISHVAVRGAAGDSNVPTLRVQWSDLDADAWRERLSSLTGFVATAVSRAIPQRLALQLMAEVGVPEDRRGTDLRREERERLIDRLTSYVLPWTGHEGYRKAEVTGGGVSLEELDAGTLESRLNPGLFLCGEMLDAFGPIGGHNFAWAWATGRLAGRGAAAHARQNPTS
jgi:predicted Rossmann fold flavoprotein